MTDWLRFLRIFLIVAGASVALIVGLIVWANPYRNIPFVSQQRPLMDLNQRYLYPSVARDLTFDSAVFGTSSIRLLKPEELEQALGGRFAELGMNDATAYEIYRLARLFLEYRQMSGRMPRTVIFGIDIRFCQVEETYQQFTPRPFPPWMFDHDPWNDLLYLFNGKTIEIAGRILAYQLGLRRKLNYESSGYSNFLPSRDRYDLARARQHIYGQEEPKPVVAQEPPFRASAAERAGWIYASHALIDDLLPLVPAQTRLLFVMVPYHHYIQAPSGSRQAEQWDECRRRLVGKARRHPNAMVVDFMRPSPITREDGNYWDPLHYSVETAALVSKLIGKAADGNGNDERYAILHDGLRR